MLYKNCRLVLEAGVKADMWLRVEAGKIRSFGDMVSLNTNENVPSIDLAGRFLAPGFIDQHVHGAGGYDFMDGSAKAIDCILQALVKEGVTSLFATTTTGTHAHISSALETLSKYEGQGGPEILGIHLEGPYLSPKAPGAHCAHLLVKPSIESFIDYQNMAGGKIKMVTLASEEDDDHQLIKYLSREGIVASMGHSKATHEEALRAFHDGCTCVTHCYNAMSGLHHRDAGLVGTALLTEGLRSEIIADKIHVSPEAMCVFDKLKRDGDKILVTDAMRAKGLEAGTYDLGGQMVYSTGSEVRTQDGALAGSVLTCTTALRNYQEVTGKSLESVIQMLTLVPAKLHGVYDRKGSIEVGKDADLVVLDETLDVYMTVCKGKVAFEKAYENNSCRQY